MTDVTVIKYSHDGERFEILVRPDPALDYKLGKRDGMSGILISDDVYADSGKGTKPSVEKLVKAFGTDDLDEVAKVILKKGELNLTTNQRRKMIEEKRKQIVTFIAKTFVDPRTHLPHPPLRIEQAMKDGRIQIDPQKSVDEQAKEVVEKIRFVLPLKSENLQLAVTVPAMYAPQSYSILKTAGTLRQESWQNDGSLKAILEIPAGSRASVIDRLGLLTRGTTTAEVVM